MTRAHAPPQVGGAYSVQYGGTVEDIQFGGDFRRGRKAYELGAWALGAALQSISVEHLLLVARWPSHHAAWRLVGRWGPHGRSAGRANAAR